MSNSTQSANVPAIEARRLNVRYSGAVVRAAPIGAVCDLNMRIQAGEVVFIIGESGCGKSSLLAALARVVPIADGQLYLFGEEYGKASFSHMQQLRRRLQLMPQDAAGSFDPRLSIGETIAYPLRWLRPDWSGATRRSAMDWSLQVSGLGEDLLERRPHECSGGQIKRAALARALVCKPDVLLLDEPFAGLDVEAKRTIVPRLKEVHKAQLTTMVVVSHEAHPLDGFADRILVMEEGRLAEGGNVAEGTWTLTHPVSQAWFDASSRRRGATVFSGKSGA